MSAPHPFCERISVWIPPSICGRNRGASFHLLPSDRRASRRSGRRLMATRGTSNGMRKSAAWRRTGRDRQQRRSIALPSLFVDSSRIVWNGVWLKARKAMSFLHFRHQGRKHVANRNDAVVDAARSILLWIAVSSPRLLVTPVVQGLRLFVDRPHGNGRQLCRHSGNKGLKGLDPAKQIAGLKHVVFQVFHLQCLSVVLANPERLARSVSGRNGLFSALGGKADRPSPPMRRPSAASREAATAGGHDQ